MTLVPPAGTVTTLDPPGSVVVTPDGPPKIVVMGLRLLVPLAGRVTTELPPAGIVITLVPPDKVVVTPDGPPKSVVTIPLLPTGAVRETLGPDVGEAFVPNIIVTTLPFGRVVATPVPQYVVG